MKNTIVDDPRPGAPISEQNIALGVALQGECNDLDIVSIRRTSDDTGWVVEYSE